MASYDVVIVGSGVIGLSSAWRLSSSGLRVGLFDPFPGRGASYAAAGMLAPITEAAWGEEDLVTANVGAAEMWPTFAEDLTLASGYSIGYRTNGTLLVAADRSDRSFLEELLDFHQHLGLASRWCSPSACNEIEPMLSPMVNGGIFAPQDHQVDNRRLLVALEEACRRNGVVLDRRFVDAISVTNGSANGIQIVDEFIAASSVVLAVGSASNAIGGLTPELAPLVRPVKGQVLRLRTPQTMPFSTHCVRGLVRGKSVYVVAREDGRIVIGATMEEFGDDLRVTAGASYELLRDAIRILPGLGEAEFVEARAGLRPTTPDNAPLVGATSISGLIFATGHYRNGILLAPFTASAVTTLLTKGGGLPKWAQAFDPQRFSNTVRGRSDLPVSQEFQPVP